jgi:uncharacterized protein
MLQSTFIHIPCIGAGTERKLWKANIRSWEDCLTKTDAIPLSFGKRKEVIRYIEQSRDAYDKKEHQYFIGMLPSNQHWRVLNDFNACYLDIETTGLDKKYDDITVIGLYDGKEPKIFVNGKNIEAFKEEIRKYQTIISFNGRCFDVPFLQHKFPELIFDQFHIDLRFVMKNLGYSGGLKLIERKLGITREEDIADIDGFEAVHLWKKYLRGDNRSLQLLIDYNKADIVNLKYLMETAFNKMKERFFEQIT